jgi:dolichol-phosphate mannosyltransferase
VPTYNEVENIPILLAHLAEVLVDVDHEVIVVDDDSPDRTWAAVADLAGHDDRIRLLRRMGTRGLSSAVVTGMAAARGRALAVLDADLQHDERVLVELVRPVIAGTADVAVGTRRSAGGSFGSFGPVRRLLSRSGSLLARCLLGVHVSDPMSGYFVLSRERFEHLVAEVDPSGFKILLEFLVRGPRPRVVEVGYCFGSRRHGESKLTGPVLTAYLAALLRLFAARLRRAAGIARAPAVRHPSPN